MQTGEPGTTSQGITVACGLWLRLEVAEQTLHKETPLCLQQQELLRLWVQFYREAVEIGQLWAQPPWKVWYTSSSYPIALQLPEKQTLANASLYGIHLA